MEQKQKRAQAPKTQKKQSEQYAELYNDLPQEVQNILMDSHPFREKNEPQEKSKPQNKQQTRRPQREDVEEVREARMQQVGSELNEMKKAPQQEGAPTKYASRRTQSAQKRRQEAEQKKQEEAEFEEIQFVSMVPAKKIQSRNQNPTVNKRSNTNDTEKEMVSQNTLMRRWKKQPEESPFPEWQNDTLHTRYETLDFAEREKQEHLDSLYENEYEDDGFHLGKSKVPIIIAGIGLILLVFLIFKTVTLSSRLHEAEIQMKEVDSLKQRYEQVQLEKMQLEEELQGIQNPDGQKEKNTNKTDKKDKTDKKEDTKKPEQKKETQTGGANTENYTVLDGETPWDIAKKVYGNGAEYQKILDANGLKEGDPIRPGDVLKVPKS